MSDAQILIENYKLGSGLPCDEKNGWYKRGLDRDSVQGVKSLGSHFACLCRGFDFYEVKNPFSKRKWKYYCTFNHFPSEKSSKRAKSTNHGV